MPLSRIVALNKPELPAVVTGVAGSAALGLMMPGAAAPVPGLRSVVCSLPGRLVGLGLVCAMGTFEP